MRFPRDIGDDIENIGRKNTEFNSIKMEFETISWPLKITDFLVLCSA